MKPKTTFRTLAGLAPLIFTASARADFPVIQSIQVEPTNLVVTAHIPPGRSRVLLESRDRLRNGAWVPVAVQRGGREGGTITFRLPRSAEFAYFRVRADATEPLPASYYTGANSFDPQPVSGPVGFWPSLTVWPIYTTFTFGAQLALAPTAPTSGFALMGDSAGVTPVESRDVVESDIWRLRGDTLYFFNQNRGLQIIDVANPDNATLRGTLNLPAVGEQMYLLSSNHVVLITRAACGDSANGEVLIVALSNGVPGIVARLPVAGNITESRLVGTALYMASQMVRPVPAGAGDTWEWGTQIASFDLAVPDAPVARSTLWYSGGNNVVHATDTYLFAVTDSPTNSHRSIVNAINITAPDGTMNARDSIASAGRVADKFKLNWADGVLSVISEVSGNPRVTKLETFRLSDPRSPPVPPSKLGEVELGHGERLFATRFDGTRAYVVTFLQIDPLWVVDLSDPAHPTVSGELQVPGWSTYIHPMGDRLVAVGREANRTTVSLFDVSDAGAPALLSRVPLGSGYSYSEANSDEKAFPVLEDAGLILLPVQGYTTNGYRSWVQLIDLGSNSLTARGNIEHDLAPRRATLHRDRIISLSGVELLSVNATDRDFPQLAGRLELAWPINRVFIAGDYLIEITTGDGSGTQDAPILRVAPAHDPNQVLTTLTLTNAPIVGATVRSNRLYLVQTRNSYGGLWFWIPSAGDGSDTSPQSPTLWLTIVDLSSLPALSVLGQTAATTSSLGWNSELEPVWPRPGLLVWAVRENNFNPMWGGSFGGILVGGPMSVSWLRPYPLQNGGGGRLLAFDVSDNTAPALLSQINLATNGGWDFSKPLATDGLVYLSHNAQVELETANTVSLTNLAIINWWPTRFQRSFLDVVDYADASHPTVRPPVNIPGALRGISHNGELLYTVGFHRASTNWNEGAEALDASAYDGVSAYLVNSLALSNVSPHPVSMSGTNVFLGRAQTLSSTTNLVPPTLETWTLSSAGNFTKLGSVTLPDAASDLVSFPGLFTAQLNSHRVLVFDNSDPAALRQVGDGPPTGCLNFNLRHGDAASARELWLPLDAYGVTRIELSP